MYCTSVSDLGIYLLFLLGVTIAKLCKAEPATSGGRSVVECLTDRVCSSFVLFRHVGRLSVVLRAWVDLSTCRFDLAGSLGGNVRPV